ncbi:MAG: ATP-binding protein [Deltaproteobacteria bacterium]|nr:ATP-binding protein [Deltaproteobacteria bacterium]
MAVLFGPNAAGKSNFIDAVQALSRVGTCRTLSDALSEPIRGYPVEAFSFPPGGLAELLGKDKAQFELSSLVDANEEVKDEKATGGITDGKSYKYAYDIKVGIHPSTGILGMDAESLTCLNDKWKPKGSPLIELYQGELHIRRRVKAARPRKERAGINYSLLSDVHINGELYRDFERCRGELSGWRTYYLDPRSAMRSARPPSEVSDIGTRGENIAPFLYRLSDERPKYFESVKRALRSLIPSVEDVEVELDKKRAELDIQVRQNGTSFSSRIISEGTLRVLALCAIAVNPWSGSLLAFEEPENGVHPRRLELIVELLVSMAIEQKRQIIVTTHSPHLCGAVFRHAQSHPDDIALLRVGQDENGTSVQRVDTEQPLFKDTEIAKGLSSGTEDGIFEALMLRGLDE